LKFPFLETFFACWAAWERRFMPDHVWNSDPLTFWRERILFIISFIASALGPLALIPSLALAYFEGLWSVILLDTGAYLAAICVLFGRRLSFTIRAWLICLMLFGLGLGLMLILGPHGAGYIWLFGASVMIAALLGFNAALWSLALNLFTLVAVGGLIAFTHPAWSLPIENILQKWGVMTVNFMLINTLVTLTTALMLNDLMKALLNEHEISTHLRESEARYRTLATNFPNGALFLIGRDFQFMAADGLELRKHGLSSDALIGRTVRRVLPEIADIVESECRYVFEGTTREFEFGFGKQTFMNQAIPIAGRDGRIDCGLIITRDVTERRKAEASLRTSEKRFRTLVENAPLGIVTVDLNGQIKDVNAKFVEIVGASSKAATLRINVFQSSQIEPTHFPDQLKNCMQNGTSGAYEGTLTSSWGKSLFLRYLLSPLVNLSGDIYAVLGFFEDITKERNQEEQLRRAQKMEALGLLAGGVAHDLNNVLSGLVSYPELLLLDLPEKSPLRNPILTIQRSGQRAAEIVQDLLTLARRGVISLEVLNLNRLVSEYLQTPEFEKVVSHHPSVRIETRLQADLLNLNCSAIHLKKTIMNLVSNAAESQPRGGTIIISTENRYVDRRIEGYDDVNEGDYTVLSIEDQGSGIAPEDLKRIFEPFYTRKVMGRSGTGLGMAVVWATVQDHEGYIDVKSVEGAGTTFELYFPATRKVLVEDKAPVPIESYTGKRESILVVDDVSEQRMIATGILERLNYRLASVPSGEAAVAYLKRHRVDLVLLDMVMDPGMDGLDTYRHILKINPGQKAIIASGFSETARVKAAIDLGVRQYIKKPYTIEKMGIALKQALQNRAPV
jgi:PAS domain S-box-containing protein